LLAAVFVVACVGLALVLWQWQEAVAARQQSDRSAAVAEEQRREAVAARKRANANLAKAIKAQRQADANARLAQGRTRLTLATLKSVVFDIQRKLTNRPAFHDLQVELLAHAITGLQKLTQHIEAGNLAEADRTTAVALMDMGDIYLEIGKTGEANALFERAHQVALRLAGAEPGNRQAQDDLYLTYSRLGKARGSMGQPVAAGAAYRKALAILGPLSRAEPGNAGWQIELVRTHDLLAQVHLQQGETRAARKANEEALRVALPLADNPDDLEAQTALATCFDRQGDLALKMGNREAACTSFQKSLQITRRLLARKPQDPMAESNLTVGLEKLGDASLQLGRTPAAQSAYEECLKIRRRRAAADPQNAKAQRDLSLTYTRLGNLWVQLQDARQARRAYEECLRIARQLTALDPRNADYQQELSIACNNVGDVTGILGDLEGARHVYREGLKINQRLAARSADATRQRAVFVSLINLAGVDYEVKQTDAARAGYRRAMLLARRLARADPDDAHVQRDLGVSYYYLGQVERQALRFAEARGWYEQALSAFRALEKAGKMDQAPAFAGLMRVLEKSVALCRLAPRAVEDLAFALAQSPELVPQLLAWRARVLATRGRHAEAARSAEKLAELAAGDADRLFDGAGAFARCAAAVVGGRAPERLTADERALRDWYEGRALALLKRARSAGYFRDPLAAARFGYDPDFAALRCDSQYSKTISGLGAGGRR
jgi:tetratricopeptide (TPR) repeat protein